MQPDSFNALCCETDCYFAVIPGRACVVYSTSMYGPIMEYNNIPCLELEIDYIAAVINRQTCKHTQRQKRRAGEESGLCCVVVDCCYLDSRASSSSACASVKNALWCEGFITPACAYTVHPFMCLFMPGCFQKVRKEKGAGVIVDELSGCIFLVPT